MKIFSHSLPVRVRQLLKAPYTERYVRLSNNSKIQSDVRYYLSSIFLIPFLSLLFT